MATEAPEIVLGIPLEIRTDNQEVHFDLVQAALGMPPHAAARWARREIDWLKKGEYLFGLLPHRFAELAAQLAHGGEAAAALDLLKALLAPVHAGRGAGLSRGANDVAGRMDVFDYGEVLTTALPAIAEAAPEASLEFLSSLLGDVLTRERKRRKARSDRDHSSIWRRAIEPHAQNTPESSVRDVLISQLRDLAERVVQADRSRLRATIAILERGDRKTRVHGRVALHLLRLNPEPELVAGRLLDRDLLEDPELRHEYARLAAEHFSLIPSEVRTEFLENLLRGPRDLADTKRRFERFLERPATDAEWANEIERWKLDRLVLFRSYLDGSIAAAYKELIERFGEPEHPEFTSYMTTFVGPTSPKTSADLAAMTVDQVIAFLSEWVPPKGYWVNSREGLAGALEGAVKEAPLAYAEAAPAFAELPLVYVGHLMFAFRQLLEKGTTLPWEPILRLAQAIVRRAADQKRENGEESSAWPRKTLADVLEAGLRGRATDIPFGLRNAVWDVLNALTRDEDPAAKEDATYGDPVNASINTVRGQALHAVFHYALWVRRNLSGGNEDAAKRLTLDSMPEVIEVLERGLMPSYEPTRTVRAVYGMWFPWIVLLDRRWAAEKVDRIFDPDRLAKELRIAAWQGYFMRDLFDDVFVILKEEYIRAVEATADSRTWKERSPRWAEGLSEHLAVLLWRGKASHEEAEELVPIFFRTAAPELRAHFLTYLGRLLSAQHITVTEEVKQRLQSLWEWRLKALSGLAEAERQTELDAFAWWFGSGKLDLDWSLRMCREVLKLAPSLEHQRMVVGRLRECAATRPAEALACLADLLRDERAAWKVCWASTTRAAVKEILTAALGTDSADIRASARRVIDRLGGLGYLEFGELVGVTIPR